MVYIFDFLFFQLLIYKFVFILGTIHDVESQTLEDRQESFFLSETCKYLYLLFDTDNPINTMGERYLFSTEGHVFPIEEKFRQNIWEFFDDDDDVQPEKSRQQQDYQTSFSDLNLNFGHDQYSKKPAKLNESVQHCDHFKQKDIQLPLEENYMSQIFSQIGAELS